ncbi:hypothetical protein AMATHDRAFT_156195 [Amanita thiersii Skay4041]|uniref:RRM domain-containing protein n=1 Tax=Amanita thiersii Skay4041 TaxID=703135 RepID=A0A2A9NEC1_9AGAR|nr:hypothetical protein AMATHDRAFT_156195 [Amanita thiersii Skay4041]
MTSSPPDISSLTLGSQPSQPRLHDSYDYEGNTGSRPPYHFATSPAIPSQSAYNPFPSSIAQSPLKSKPIRSGLPTQWLDNNPSDSRSLSPQNNSDFSSAGGSPPMGHINPPGIAPITPAQSSEDEIIPTAIVIKNIPFNVKRETLLDLIASLSIPTPYAFNYHLDQQGSFRGLAFANFRQAADADAVVAALNGFDVQGRKLRVEYKKVLQAGEKERIEREKAIRRMRSMQLEKEQQQQAAAATGVSGPISSLYEDYGSAFSPGRSFSAGSPYQQPYSPPSLSSAISSQYGLSSLSSAPPLTPQSGSNSQQLAPLPAPTPSGSEKGALNELDMNDPSTLEIYSRVLLFKDDHMRDELAFSRTLTAKQRRIVHLVAQKLGVYHYSVGEGEERYAVVTRIDPQRQQQQQQTQRQVPHTLSRTPSAYLSPTSQAANVGTLRVKKSMPDMKTLHSQAPRLTSRASNGNIRDGFATIASPSRRVSSTYLFSSNSPFGGGIPPVPSLPSNLSGGTSNGNGTTGDMGGIASGVLRQPRGPGVAGFGRRDSRVAGAGASTVSSTEGQSRGGLDAQTHEPLEM